MKNLRSTAFAISCIVACSLCGAWVPYNPITKEGPIGYDPSRLGLVPSMFAPPLPPASGCVAYFLLDVSLLPTRDWWCLKQADGKIYRVTAWSGQKYNSAPGEIDKPLAVDLPEDIGDIVYSLWINAILEVRVRNFEMGADGYSCYFGSLDTKTGIGGMAYVFEPTEDLPPKWLVGAGEEIMKYIRDPKRDEARLRRSMQKTQERVFEYYRNHPQY
jgi:hypothetical protein